MIVKIKNLFVLLLLFGGIALSAQNIQVMMSPKPSPYVSDWQSQTETVKLIITNSSTDDIEVKIKAQLYKGTGDLLAATKADKMPIMEIPSGVSIYNAEDVFPLHAVDYNGNGAQSTLQTGKIPEDNYRLCVTLTDPKTGESKGTSGTVCKMFSIVSYQASILITPLKDQKFTQAQTNGIMFRWTPVIPKPQGTVIFRLRVWEVLDGQTPMMAIRTNQPIVEKDLRNVLQSQWPIDFEKSVSGPRYVWTITCLDEEERALPDGNGMSEPSTFTIKDGVHPWDGSYKITAPELISPSKGQQFSKSNTKQILFKWTSANAKPDGFGPVYRLSIWELKEGQTAKSAMQKNAVLLEKKVKGLTQIQIPIDKDKLLGGPIYVWCITALDEEERAMPGGNGMSDPSTFSISSAGCGTNDANISIKCDKIVNGVQTYTVDLIFNNTAPTGVQNCETEMNAITSSTGTLTGISSLPAIIPSNGTVSVSFIYTPSSSSANTADFGFLGVWDDGNSNTSNFSKLENKLPKCAKPNCCPGKWRKYIDESTGRSISHLTNLGTVKCKSQRKFTFCYSCPKGCGESSIRYEVLNSVGTVVSTLNTSNCVTTVVTFPSVAGTYQLRVSGFCNGKLCNWLRYPFTLECDTVKDCCEEASFKNPIIQNPDGKVLAQLECGKRVVYDISEARKNCHLDLTIRTSFNCGSSKECQASTKISITGPGYGNSGSGTIVFPSTAANGMYNVTINYYCGKTLCKSCIFQIRKKCDTVVTNCCLGKWEKYMDESTGKPIGHLTNLGEVKCKSQRKFTFCYGCPEGCGESKIKYEVINASGAVVSTIDASNCATTVVTFPSTEGSYQLRVSGFCNGKLCAWLRYPFTIKCKNCCEEASFKNPIIQNSDGKTLYNIICGKKGIYHINEKNKNCDMDLTIITSFNCGSSEECQKQAEIKITGPGYSNSGVGAIIFPSSAANGTYNVTISYYCGKTICKKCTFRIVKNCPPCENEGSLNLGTGLSASGGLIAMGAVDPNWSNGSREPSNILSSRADWNNIPGHAILVPSGQGGYARGTHTFKRCLWVCKNTTVNFNGIFRTDNKVQSFVLKNAITNAIAWQLSGSQFPTNNPQCWKDNPYSGSVTLSPGQYCFEFKYRNYSSVGGFSLSGSIISNNNGLTNTEGDCCPLPTMPAVPNNDRKK